MDEPTHADASPADRASVDTPADPVVAGPSPDPSASVPRWMRAPLFGPLDPAVLLAVVLLAFAALQSFAPMYVRPDFLRTGSDVSNRAHQADYYQIWAVGGLIASHPDIYSPEARQELGSIIQARAAMPGASAREVQAAGYWPYVQTTGTPFIYALFGILQTGAFELDSVVFQAVSLVALIGSLLWLGRRVRLGRAAVILLPAIVVATSMPAFMDLGWGNVDCLQVAMLVAYLALRAGRGGPAREIAAGAVLGLAILFKPNLALIVPLVGLELLLARRWRDALLQVAGLAVAGAAALAVTALRFGSIAPWSEWLAALSSLAPNYGLVGYSVPATILHLIGVDPPTPTQIATLGGLLMVALLGVTVGVLAWSRLPRTWAGGTAGDAARVPGSSAAEDDPDRAADLRWGREALIVGAAVGITLLAAPFAWYHYYLLLVPLLAVLLRPDREPFGGTGFVGLRQLAAAVSLFLLSAVPAVVWAARLDAVPYLVCLAAAATILVVSALFELTAREGLTAIRVPFRARGAASGSPPATPPG